MTDRKEVPESFKELVYGFIIENPGATQREVAEGAKISYSDADTIIKALLKDERLWTLIEGRTFHYCPWLDDPKDLERFAPAHRLKNRKLDPERAVSSWKLNFNLGNVVRYMARSGRDSPIEELIRARQYLDLEISRRRRMA